MFDALARLPRVTEMSDLPGIGGRIKTQIDDFEVEELTLREPCGTGAFLYVWIEKRGVDATSLVEMLCTTLGITEHDVGMAGLKDARAITRQWVSVPAACNAKMASLNERLEDRGVQILRSSLHDQPLRRGQLRGNRFSILVRDPGADALARTEALLSLLEAQGIPNYFGRQRFGREGTTLERGLALLSGKARLRRNSKADRFALSSVQSCLFNRYLALRISDGLFHQAIDGELLQSMATGLPEVVNDTKAAQERLDAGKVVPAGPLAGARIRRTRGEAALREKHVLKEAGLLNALWEKVVRQIPGARRPICVYPRECRAESCDEHVRLHFELPPGAYATELLEEVLTLTSTDNSRTLLRT